MAGRDHEEGAAGARRPLRSAGLRRYGQLLDATEALLAQDPENDISLAMVAEAARVPLPSVYHFFPNRNAILVALAERFHGMLAANARRPLDPPPQSWQEIIRRRQVLGVAFLNAHPAALRLFMGAGVSVEVRNLDLRGNASLAVVRAGEVRYWFESAGLGDLERWVAVSIGLADGIWAISWAEHRQVTEAYLKESAAAAIAYLRCYLPEYLPPRQPRQ